jgi:hypothetical protein
MGKPTPWHKHYPRKYWAAEDWRAARKAGVVPPLPKPPVDPADALLASTIPAAPSLPGGLDGDRSASREDERRRAADRVLKASGVR